MLRNIFIALFLCAALLYSACAAERREASDATPKASPDANRTAPPAKPDATPQAQVVTASVEEVKIDAGGSAETAVRLDIADGYHVNANPPSDKYYIGTQLEAETQEGITPGKPVYPPALTKKFSFSEKPLAVYEGAAVIRLPLRAQRGAAKGRHTFKTRILVQPCNDQACLRPRTIEAAIPIRID
jgi:hypothetical protein